MANVKITELLAGSSLDGTEELVAVQDGVTVRIQSGAFDPAGSADLAQTGAETYASDEVALHAAEPDEVHGFVLPTSHLVYEITEISLGVWDADPPFRADGKPRIIFNGATSSSNPKDVTNGVTTPENVSPRDLVVRPVV